MKLDDLLKKLHSLKDLRAAINEVKSLQKDAKIIPMHPAHASIPDRNEQRSEAQGSLKENKSYLKHLGMDTGMKGRMTHMVGIPGSNWNYKVHMDMHDAAQQKPAFHVQMVDNKGNVQSQSNKIHSDIGSAVKDLVGHSHSGKWQDD